MFVDLNVIKDECVFSLEFIMSALLTNYILNLMLTAPESRSLGTVRLAQTSRQWGRSNEYIGKQYY